MLTLRDLVDPIMERKHVKADVGVLVGRFQVAKLHAGHLELLLWVCGEHRKVIVVLGVAAVPGLRENPLDFESRAQMLYEAAREHNLQLVVVPLSDCRTNEGWSARLDSLVGSLVGPSQSVVLYGSRDSFLQHYAGSYNTQELTGSQESWSGTEERNVIRQAIRYTEDFRAGIIWASHNRYKGPVTTVDAAIFRSDKVLLARRAGEKLVRFIGGFAESDSPNYEHDVVREVLEETGLSVRNVRYVCSRRIDDWRYRGCDKIKTIFYRMDACDGAIQPQDKTELFDYFYWSDPKLVSVDTLTPEHRPLLEALLKDIEANG